MSAMKPNPDPSAAWLEVARTRDPVFLDERRRMLDLLVQHPDCLERTSRPGHFTGSALIVDPSTATILLLFHTKLQLWLQPGGHADGDGNLAHVAWREATEETGIEGLRVVQRPIDLDIHRVDPPAEDAHLHFDVRYLVVAPPGAQPSGNHESEALRWVDLTEFDELVPDDNTRRMARRALHRLRTHGLTDARSSER
ncbi:MAG: NUDIX hydrolase [Acidimicrobiales bacterium]|nr:NUDIX hydrolase [Acidimicrobiales bacterium]